jgi:HK97 family phage portal protein
MPAIKSLLSRLFGGTAEAPLPPRRKSIDIGKVINIMLRQGIMDATTYEQRAEVGYQKNNIVFRGVRQVQIAVSQVQWELFRVDAKGDRELVISHPLLDLISRPSEYFGRARFFEQMVGYLLIGGANFVHRLMISGAPRELRNLRPDLVKPVLNKKRTEVLSWKYNFDTPDEQTFEAEDVLPLYLFNPKDEWEGFSPISAAANVVDQSNLSRDYNAQLLVNSGRPSGILRSSTEIDEETEAEIRAEFREKHQGVENAGSVLLLEGDITWEKTGLSPADLEWLDGQQQADRNIAVTLGVPPQNLGDTQSQTYSNYKEARAALYQEEVVPFLLWISSELNRWLVQPIDPALKLVPNIDSISALQENRTETADRLEKSDWLTVGEKREAAGFEQLGNDADQVIITRKGIVITPEGEVFGPANLVPLGEGAAPGAPAAAGGEDEQREADLLELVIAGLKQTSTSVQSLIVSKKRFPALDAARSWAKNHKFHTQKVDETESSWRFRQFQPESCQAGSFRTIRITDGVQAAVCRQKKLAPEFKFFDLKTKDEKDAHWKAIDEDREKFNRAMSRLVEKEFRREAEEIEREMARATDIDDAAKRIKRALKDSEHEWEKIYGKIYTTVGEHFARRTVESLPKGVAISDWAAFVRLPDAKQDTLDPFREEFDRFIEQESGTKIKGINKTTLTDVRKQLALGAAEGEGMDQLAKRIDGFLDKIIPHRAEVVARTEVINASNAASDFAAKASTVVKRKEWISTRDDRIRDTHKEADEQVVPVDDPFTVGGFKLQWPGDSSLGAPAEEVIQCRCTVGYLTD